jgi:cardiolipin synthase
MPTALATDAATVSAVLGAVLVAADFLIKVIALGVIPGNRKPAAGMAWLILIMVIPFGGILLFLLFGQNSVGKDRRAKQAEADAAIRHYVRHMPASAPTSGPDYLPSVATLNSRLTALPWQPGNRIQLFPGYQDAIDAMTEAVEGAQSAVEVQFYISAWDDVTDPFFSAVVAAHDRGVRVRVLYDHLGSRGIPGFKDFVKRLDAAGLDHHAMLPIHPLKGEFRRPDLRNHRKILVVDGLTAFAGSMNMTEPGYNKPKNHKVGRKWVELVAKVEGPAVSGLRAVFATDWFKETGEIMAQDVAPVVPPTYPDGVDCQVVPSGPGYPTQNNLLLFTTLVHAARHRVSITSPYFVPDEPLLNAVTTAAQRGLDVELFVSEEADQFMVGHAQRSYYQALLEAGVRIYLYPAPAVLHSKHFSIDDDVAVIGSSNMDMRSFALNAEVSLLATGASVVADMKRVEDTYRGLSRELTLEEWRERSAGSKYVDNAMRLTSSLQ